MSGSAPIKVIRVRIVALRFGVCAVTEDVSPSAPDIVPSGQSRPSSICKVLSPSKPAASPLGDARISLRRLGMSLALCPSQKSLDPLYALPRYRPLSLLTWIRRLCPKLSMRPPLLRSEDWDRSHSQSHSGVSRCRVGVLQLCTSLANCQTGAPHYPMRESESLQSPQSSPSPRTLYRMAVSVFGVVAVRVVCVSDLSRPSQSLTLAQTVLQSLQSIADLSESHAMDLFNQCESPLDTCAVSGACVFEVVAVKVMCVSLLGRSTGHRGA